MELHDLIESVDIVAFISQFVELEQRGDEFWGKSCFKEEKTPSFSVRAHPPCFFDYSSGIGGNVFTFVRYYYHCGATDAIEILKKYAGVEGEISAPAKKLSASLVCRRFLPQPGTQKQSAGVKLPADVMLRYEKTPEKLAVWEREGISRESLDRFQVFYDAFSDRLVYPIRSVDGTIVNIGGRTLDPAWKEKNLRKYSYFYPWGTMNTVYALFDNREAIRQAGEIILFEGCKSVLLADTWGIRNCGAILTSHINRNQMKILAGLGCRVVFALDQDVDVTKDRNIEKLKRYVRVEYLRDTNGLLREKDAPVDRGREVFQTLYDTRIQLR